MEGLTDDKNLNRTQDDASLHYHSKHMEVRYYEYLEVLGIAREPSELLEIMTIIKAPGSHENLPES